MNRLRDARMSCGLSQRALAKEAGLTSTAISRYETGKRKLTVETAKLIASVLGVDWVSLFESPDTKVVATSNGGGGCGEPGTEV